MNKNIGIAFLIIASVTNEFVLGYIFAVDQIIESFSSKVIIRSTQLFFVIIGLVFYFRRVPIEKKKVQAYIKNVALVISSVLVTLVISEFTIRTFFPQPLSKDFLFRVPHESWGWSLIPDTSYINMKNGQPTYVQYNSAGFRDIDHAIEKPEETFRILILGDSFIEGYTVDLEQTLSRRLAKQFEQNHEHIEVISMGVGGFGTLQELLVYKEMGQLYDPDLILLAFYTMNDLQNNSIHLNQGSRRPFLDLKDDGDWTISSFDYANSVSLYERDKEKAVKKEKHWSSKIHILRLVQKAFSQSDKYNYELLKEKSLIASKCEEEPSITSAWNITQKIFELLLTAVSENKAKLFVFTVPAIYETDPIHMKRLTDLINNPVEYCIESAPGNKRLLRILENLDIPHLDLLPIFRLHYDQPEAESLYADLDHHWNKNGHDLAATKLYLELRDKSLVPH